MVVVLTSTRSRGGARLFFRVAAMAYCSTESSGARSLLGRTGAEARASLVSLLPRDAWWTRRAKPAKKAATLPARRRAGPTAPTDPRRDVFRAAACSKRDLAKAAGLPNGLRRPQRRRADGRGRDARDLRDVRVSSLSTFTEIPEARLRCRGRRDRALRYFSIGRWAFL